MADAMVRTTLSLPEALIRAADRAVRAGKARSRNEFVATALRHELAALRRAEIDAEFAAMADDEEYRAEAIELSKEFEAADREAFRLGERTYAGGEE